MLAKIEKILSYFSKPVLVVISLVSLGIGYVSIKNWVDNVNNNIGFTLNAYSRLTAVEVQVDAIKDEIRKQRIDQLEYHKWWAEDHDDKITIRRLEKEIQALRSAK